MKAKQEITTKMKLRKIANICAVVIGLGGVWYGLKTWATSTFLFIKTKLIALTLAILIPTVEGLFFAGMLIVSDTVLGIWAAKREGGWEAVNSKDMGNGLYPKLIIYPSIVLLGSACEYFFPDIPFMKGGIFLLMSIELKSIEEKASKILGIKVRDYVKQVILKYRTGDILKK